MSDLHGGQILRVAVVVIVTAKVTAAPTSTPMFHVDQTRWDTCAPQIIVEEAGGVVLPFSGSGEGGMADVEALLLSRDAGGTPPSSSSVGGDLRLSYNKPDLASPHCLFLGRYSSSSTKQVGT